MWTKAEIMVFRGKIKKHITYEKINNFILF